MKMLLVWAMQCCLIGHAFASKADLLRNAMIWHPEDSAKAVGFRRQFNYNSQHKPATICIFADNRYMLWINGQHVMRGPCRFDPKRPEYDSFEVSKYLHAGINTIAVLVYGHISSGESMEHAPGLALYFESGTSHIITDTGWLCSNHTRFGDPDVQWDGIRENVNAAKEDGDWLSPEYHDAGWSHAVIKNKTGWGEFYPRITPLPVATELPFFIAGKTIPFEVKGPADIHLQLEKNIMGYCIFRFSADAGTRLDVFGHHYTARQGQQEYITADVYGSGLTTTFGTSLPDDPDSVYIPVHIDSGRIRFTDIRVVNFIAPLKLAGSFESSDTLLNRFWKVIANMHAQVTQDTYTDGATEGNEWVADVHNVYLFTKVAFAERNKNGIPVYQKNSYLAKALSDIAVSQQPDGRVKAHHPSDRFDLHWFIEDFSCTWIADLRAYYEMTKDKALVTRLWPAVKKQMNWFEDSIGASGLFHGREWCIFDNPYAYRYGEGATLNAFVYRAFIDAAWLAGICSDAKTALEFSNKAVTIKKAFSKYFWNEAEGTFRGMIDSSTTIHAAVMSLYSGICGDEHKKQVAGWLINKKQDSILYPYLHLFWFKCLYDMNSDEADQQVLDIIHTKYNNKWNALNKGYLTAEGCNAGRNFHNFGMVPGYFLSAYILGVRADAPVWDNHILIEPRLGNIQHAKGVVVTPYGPVPVSWNRTNEKNTLDFSFTVPRTVTAKVGIPKTGDQPSLTINGIIMVRKGKALRKNITVTDRFIYLDKLAGGSYSGKLY